MKKTKLIIGILIASGLLFESCKKEGCTDPLADNFSEDAEKEDNSCTFSEKAGTLEVKFDHKWGSNQEDFSMNTNYVHPMTGDNLKFTKFKYYVSNLSLKDSDGVVWSEENSYHLFDLSNGIEPTIILKGVPAGTYTEMNYVLGVDSTRNVSGAQTGALSVANTMFWSWNSGYIMLKAEGESPESSSGTFTFHLGGFSGENSVVTSKIIDFGSEKMSVNDKKTTKIHLIANPARLWHSAESVGTTSTTHMPGTTAKQMTGDFYSNISFDHIHYE